MFGAADQRDNSHGYLGILIVIQSGLTLLVVVILAFTIWFAHLWVPLDGLEAALGGMALAAPFVLLLWLARGAFYVRMAPQFALAGSTVYCLLVLGTLLVVDRLRLMSPFAAFVIMGFAALVSSFILLKRLKPTLQRSADGLKWGAVREQHWHYGRWLLASFGLGWIPANIYYSLVSIFSGMSTVGELKVLVNFTLPVAQTLTALSVCFLPHASRVWQLNGREGLRRLMFKIGCLFAAAVVVYWVGLISFGAPILHSLYRGHYTDLAPLIPWVAAGSIPWNLATVPTIALRAVRSSVSIFRVYLASSGVAVAVGIPATWRFGLRGALVAIILSNASALAMAIYLMRRELQPLYAERSLG